MTNYEYIKANCHVERIKAMTKEELATEIQSYLDNDELYEDGKLVYPCAVICGEGCNAFTKEECYAEIKRYLERRMNH